MLRITFLMVVVLAGACGNTGLLLAQTHVVVAAGVAEEPRTGVQFEYAIAAAVDSNDTTQTTGTAGLRSDGDLVQAFEMNVGSVVLLDGSVEISGTADLKLHRGPRISQVPVMATISENSVSFALDLGQGVVLLAGTVFSGGNSIGAFEPELLVVALGEGTTVESTFQAAAAIDSEGRAVGRLSLLANRDNGDLVRVDGVVDGAALGPHVGRRRLQLRLAGVAAVDVFRPDGTSPDTCFGDFRFAANEGPHGSFRIDVPECRDALAGIEGSDISPAPGVIQWVYGDGDTAVHE